MRIIRITLLSLLLLMIALPLYAGGRLTYYCSTDIPWCELMKKEFPELSRVGRGKVENQCFSDEYIRSKKTGIPQSMYQQFPIPITAGLLATQGEEDNRTGLLQ